MKKKSVYDSVTNEKRIKLIQMVNKGEKLNHSAHVLNINYSTAKTILRIFRNESRIFKKIPVKYAQPKKKVFSIDRSLSTKHSYRSESPSKDDFKQTDGVIQNKGFTSFYGDFNFYLNLRAKILMEIGRNVGIINYLSSFLHFSSNSN